VCFERGRAESINSFADLLPFAVILNSICSRLKCTHSASVDTATQSIQPIVGQALVLETTPDPSPSWPQAIRLTIPYPVGFHGIDVDVRDGVGVDAVVAANELGRFQHLDEFLVNGLGFAIVPLVHRPDPRRVITAPFHEAGIALHCRPCRPIAVAVTLAASVYRVILRHDDFAKRCGHFAFGFVECNRHW